MSDYSSEYDEDGNYIGGDVTGEVSGGGNWWDGFIPVLQTGVAGGLALGTAALNNTAQKQAGNRAENIGGTTVAPVSGGMPKWVLYAGAGVVALLAIFLVLKRK